MSNKALDEKDHLEILERTQYERFRKQSEEYMGNENAIPVGWDRKALQEIPRFSLECNSLYHGSHDHE